MSEDKVEELKRLYEEIAAHTRPECAGENCGCAVPMSCCDEAYCEYAIRHAKDEYGIVLEPTGHPRFPLMGETGCVAAPYLRPMCAVHACCVNKFGGKTRGNGAAEWNKRYFDLRDRIEVIELGG